MGTLGGGAIEFEALAQARVVLERGRPLLFRRDLGRDLGMCCGGEMSVFIEAVEPKPRLFVFGAGTIGRPLVALAQGCGFELTVVDGRAEWARADRFPGATVVCRDAEDGGAGAGDRARRLRLRRDPRPRARRACGADPDPPPAGLPRAWSGAGRSSAPSCERLRAARVRDEEIARLRTPLGLAIGADTPEEIAVSVVAQLIAVRRGVPIEAGWESPRRTAEEVDPAAVEPPGHEGGGEL